MSTLLVAVSELQVTELELRAEPGEWDGFTHIQVFRSQVGQDGPYEELSGSWWASATLPEDATAPSSVPAPDVTYKVSGLTLSVIVDQVTTLSTTFSGTDPLDASACVAQISADMSPYVAPLVDAFGRLTISSVKAGGQSSICASGDASSVFGFSEGVVVFGKDPRPILHRSRTSYSFRDYFGSSDYFYKTRFINLLSGAVSEFSQVIRCGMPDDLPTSSIAVGYLRCLSAAGKAQKNVRAIIQVDPQLASSQDRLVTGVPQERLTDENGYVEFQLVRGLVATLVVPDMGLVRKITVPDDARFNLLEAGLGTDDPFDVRRISITSGERRNF
jgi:hypothetical protein